MDGETCFYRPLRGLTKLLHRDPGVARYALTPGYYLSPLRGEDPLRGRWGCPRSFSAKGQT